MAFYRIDYPAYFCAKDNAERPANSLLVNGEQSRDLHMRQIANSGGGNFTVSELTASEYRAEVMARLGR